MDYYVYEWWCYATNEWVEQGVHAVDRKTADAASLGFDWEGGGPPSFLHVVGVTP